MPSYTTLKGFSKITDRQPSDILEDSLVQLLDWSFVDKGSYVDVRITSSGSYGGNHSTMGPLDHPSYNDGQVWQTHRGHWVWESGHGIDISGVWIGGSLYGSGDATYGHHYDYINGRVIFDTAISTTSNVKIEYSYKWINIVPTEEIPFLRAIKYSQRPDLSDINLFGSGNYDELYRIDMPLVGVEVAPKSRVSGYELGSGARVSHNRVLLRVVGEDKSSARRVADILADQEYKSFYLFNTNEVIASGAIPLDYRGSIVDNTKIYPELVKFNTDGGYRWKKLFVENSESTNFQELGEIWIADVVWDTEIILTEV